MPDRIHKWYSLGISVSESLFFYLEDTLTSTNISWLNLSYWSIISFVLNIKAQISFWLAVCHAQNPPWSLIWLIFWMRRVYSEISSYRCLPDSYFVRLYTSEYIIFVAIYLYLAWSALVIWHTANPHFSHREMSWCILASCTIVHRSLTFKECVCYIANERHRRYCSRAGFHLNFTCTGHSKVSFYFSYTLFSLFKPCCLMWQHKVNIVAKPSLVLLMLYFLN